MDDKQIRKYLRNQLLEKDFKNKDVLIVEEFSLFQGETRIDMAVLNNKLHGYEIKSAKDTLLRLSKQQEIYNKIFNYLTIITEDRHVSKIVKSVPKWWSIYKIFKDDETYRTREIRLGYENPSIDSFALATLLWREEALEILKRFDAHKGVVSKSKFHLWNRLSHVVGIDELQEMIYQKIRARQNWRSASLRVPNDGLFQPVAIS